MDCKRCCEDLTAYLDGELAPARAAEIASHVRACAPCGLELKELQEAGEFVRRHAVMLEPRPEIWNNLRARIALRPEAGPARSWLAGWLWNRRLAAAGAAAAVVLGVWGYVAHRESRRSLERYMMEYIQQRETVAGAVENPFVLPPEFENPFRPEEQ